MAALEPHYLDILKTVLATRFVPYLPPLLGKVSAADQAAKQLSRAFSAFVLHKLLDITPQAARIDAHLLNHAGVTRLCYCGSVLHTLPEIGRAHV